jgi:uncharacterized membrane protein YfhO
MKNKDLHKQQFVDNARLELGTKVQFFKFNLDDMVMASMVPAIVIFVLYWLTSIDAGLLFATYLGSWLTILVFYLIIGTDK